MDDFSAYEAAYKNGFNAGYLSGETESIRKIIMFLEAQMAEPKSCKCKRSVMPKFYNYCPYCGEKY